MRSWQKKIKNSSSVKLKKRQIQIDKLYYPDTGLLISALEEDFFVRTRDELIPVEVKSNNDRSKSLTALIKNEHYSDIKHGIKLGDFNVGYANGIYTFPYFCAFMVKAYLKSLD